MGEYRFTETGGESGKRGEHIRYCSASDRYSSETEAGFLEPDGETAGEDFYTGTAGWIPGEKALEEEPVFLRDSKYGAEINSSVYPLRFGINAAAGRYKITVEIKGGSDGTGSLTLCAGRRNIVERGFRVQAGTRYRKTFFYGVYLYRPVVRADEAVLDPMIGISIIGEKARLSRIYVEKVREDSVPALFIGGDSTVRDYEGIYPYNPLTNGGSWGQNLQQYFDGMLVCNQAHSGLTSKCFREDGHWELVKKALRPGDVFLFGFGHNDQKRRNLKPYDQFAANFRAYIMETRQAGAIPILVTPMSRIPGKNEDGWYDLLEAQADSIRQVGKEMKVPVIDLHSLSFHLFCSMGRDVCQQYFNDTTHVNDYGGALLAELIAGEIRRIKAEPLCSHLRDGSVSAWKPDLSLRPEGREESSRIEERPNLSTDLPELPYTDCRELPEEELKILKQAMKMGILDPCVRFLHPHEEMPRAQFVYLLLKMVKPSKKRFWQGQFCDLSPFEFDAEQIQAALDEDLIDPESVTENRFRPDDPITWEEAVSFVVRAGAPGKDRRFLDLASCWEKAESRGWIPQSLRNRRSPATRAECIGIVTKL